MAIAPIYAALPFSWDNKSAETIQNDCQWLEGIIRNAAPFSDWWVKARIVQLAYVDPKGRVPGLGGKPKEKFSEELAKLQTYAGLKSEAEILRAIGELCDLKQYPALAAQLNEEYVIKTLNSWKSQEFSKAIGRNFEVYADRHHPNVFLVTSTAPVSMDVDRQLPPSDRFRPLFNVEELAGIVQQQGCQRVTLRVHGYATPANAFYKLFTAEAESLNSLQLDPTGRTLDDQHFYIGYQWPSEQPVVSPSLWLEFPKNWGIILKFLLVLAGLAGVFGTVLYALRKLLVVPGVYLLNRIPALDRIADWLDFSRMTQVSVAWYWMIAAIFMLWLLLMQTLRVLAYQRDRYRAIHYGAPDLAEFFWRLDKALIELSRVKDGVSKSSETKSREPKTSSPNSQILRVNLIGHSMGALVLVNGLRILCDRFGKDDYWEPEPISVSAEADTWVDRIGDRLQLDKLIMLSPDIPLVFLREGRNNYVRSAMRRCGEIYLLSSDRDLVLRYLAMLANWFSEPSLEMSGYRLGNLYLRPTPTSEDRREYRPFVRNMFRSQPAVIPTSAYDLFERFNYLDCSEMKGLNGVKLRLNPFTGVAIDLVNLAMYLSGKIDVHGGYLFTNTPTFALVKLLITTNERSPKEREAIIKRAIANTPIRFLPSQPLSD